MLSGAPVEAPAVVAFFSRLLLPWLSALARHAVNGLSPVNAKTIVKWFLVLDSI